MSAAIDESVYTIPEYERRSSMSPRLPLILGFTTLIAIGGLAYLTLSNIPQRAPLATTTPEITSSSSPSTFVDDDPDNSGIVGVGLAEAEGHVLVTKVIKNTPADLAGLRAGDEIDTVGGRSIQGLSIDQVIALLHRQ